MNKVGRFLLCLLLCGTGASLANQVWAQVSKCPYEYFELPVFSSITNNYVYSFRVSYQGQQRLACALVSELHDYFVKYEHLTYDLSTGQRMMDLLTKGRVLESKVPFDSLDSFTFSPNPTEADAVAAKGEGYFLRYYFNPYGCLREERKVNMASVMKHLQNWCILGGQNHETGCLIYHSKLQKITP
jgi:hypothetical protein